jgi:hypothetical protein
MVELKLVKHTIKVLGKADKISILVPGENLKTLLSNDNDIDLMAPILSLPHKIPMIVVLAYASLAPSG